MDKIITLCHSSLFAGHQWGIKTYLTIGNKFFIPGLMHYFHSFIKGYHICQLARKDKPQTGQLQTRIYLYYRPFLRLSMDLKVIPKTHMGHQFILCVIDEVTNYLFTAPFYQSRSEEIVEALIEAEISKCCIQDYIIIDLGSAFVSTLLVPRSKQ